MSEPASAPRVPSLRIRRSRLTWRAVFVFYFLLLVTSTHWPRLELGSEAHPAPDKLFHVAGFAVLALLLWRTGWIKRRWVFLVVMLAWTAVDELTQALPGLHREISWQDLLGSQCGVLMVAVWIWALGPVGGPANRARLRFNDFVFESLFGRVLPWVVIGTAGLLAAGLVGPLVHLLASWLLDSTSTSTLFLSVFAAGVFGSHATFEALRKVAQRQWVLVSPCVRCGEPCENVDRRAAWFACDTCGDRQWRGQWLGYPTLPRWRILQLLRRPMITCVLIALALAVGYVLLVVLHTRVPLVGRFNRFYGSQPYDLRMSVDMTMIVSLGALMIRLFRLRLASLVDTQDRECMWCGHDVHAATREHGVGRCTECGRTFVATDPHDESQPRSNTA